MTTVQGHDGTGPVRRVVVAHPETLRARRAPHSVARPRPAVAAEPSDADTGAVLALMAAHRGAALRTLAQLVAILFGLPIVFASVPAVSDVVLWGVPLPWFVLGPGIFPVLLVIGVRHHRTARRLDADHGARVADHTARVGGVVGREG